MESSYSALSQSLLNTLRSLEDPDLELDTLAEQMEQGYALLEKLKAKLTETECQVEKVIRLHQGAPT
jgi:exodeoxyribonuclease VII small subunit